MPQNAEIATRFLNEARAVNIVQHPGMVNIFEFCRLPDGAIYKTRMIMRTLPALPMLRLHRSVAMIVVALLITGCSVLPSCGQVPVSVQTGQAIGVSPVLSFSTATPLPAGCQSQQDGENITLSCAINNVFGSVPLDWTGSRVAPIAAPGTHPQPVLVTTRIMTNGQLLMHLDRHFNYASGGPGAPTDETATFTFGPAIKGLLSATLSITAGTISGTVNGRSIIPLKVAAGITPQGIKYADGQPAPTVTIDQVIQAALKMLAEQVEKTMPIGGAGWANPVEEAGAQNDIGAWNTPDCQSCERSCGANLWDWLAPPAALACEAACFIPITGGCAEKVCNLSNGFGTCDSSQICCGGICCGSGSVCGSDSLGYCCPSGDPVLCGDITSGLCFTPGASCCGDRVYACESGWACQNATGGCCPDNLVCDGECCAQNQTCQRGPSQKGVCCQTPLCGDQCCGQGEICFNGQCSLGQPCGKTLCGPLGSICCNGTCCVGTCLNDNSCCPSAQQSCGNDCCPYGQLCVNGACASSPQPTLLLYAFPGGDLIAWSGGPRLSISDTQSIVVTGQSFALGLIVISVDAVGGPQIATAPADASGYFKVTITTGLFPLGNHAIVASEGALEASVDVNVGTIR